MTVMRPETLGSSTTVVPKMPEISSTMSRSSALFIASCHFSCAACDVPDKARLTRTTSTSMERKACTPMKQFMMLITLTARKPGVDNA
ncbi:hypothetical protein D3C73_1188570 [compost metagenome]